MRLWKNLNFHFRKLNNFGQMLSANIILWGMETTFSKNQFQKRSGLFIIGYYRNFLLFFCLFFLLKTFILVCENSCYKNKKFRALLKALKALKPVIRSKKFSLYDCLAVTLNTNYYKKPVYKKPRALKYSNEA